MLWSGATGHHVSICCGEKIHDSKRQYFAFAVEFQHGFGCFLDWSRLESGQWIW